MTNILLIATTILSFVLYFIILWILIIFIFSSISGWNKLSNFYAIDKDINLNGIEYKWQSIRMNLVNYSFSVIINICENGTGIKPLKIFSFFHKPLFIPFEAVEEFSEGSLILNYVLIKIKNIKIYFYGFCLKDLISFYTRWKDSQKN